MNTLAQHPFFRNPSIGLGCMNLSHAYGTPLAEPEALQALEAAFDMGYRHFDTATLYGATKNETLVGKALSAKRQQLFLASKCGMEINLDTGKREINGRPETPLRQCEASLKRLKTDHIDLYYLHRLDPNVAIEESVGALSMLVEKGHIGAIGLSEISAETLQRANKEAFVGAVQSEYSLWTRNPEIALLDACRAAGTTLVAFSPVGRGFLADAVHNREALVDTDLRLNMPRFSAENLPKNLKWLNRYREIAQSIEVTPAQPALAWIKAQDACIVSIPGTRNTAHMQENLLADEVTLDAKVVEDLNDLVNQRTVAGARYNATQQVDIDTEEF